MKYAKADRLKIGEEIYLGRVNKFEAGEIYGISPETARDYERQYKAKIHTSTDNLTDAKVIIHYSGMTKERLIEIILEQQRQIDALSSELKTAKPPETA